MTLNAVYFIVSIVSSISSGVAMTIVLLSCVMVKHSKNDMNSWYIKDECLIFKNNWCLGNFVM